MTFAVRGDASSATSVATSSGVVKRPVGMAAVTWSRTAAGSTPAAAPRLAATPSWPSQRSVATGPGETLLMRIPRGPSSCERAFATLSSAAFAAP